jgi:outer membrane immunogenic protein
MLESAMRRFATVAACFVSVAAFAGAVQAADLPVKTYTKAPPMVAPVYDWSGFYIGLNAGGASSRECWTVFSVANLPVGPDSEGCHNATGGLVGGQIGYRWQATNFVFGLDAQGDWASLKGSNSSLAAGIFPFINQTKIDGIGLFTGQIGYAFNNVLLYVKGGAAVTDNHYSSFFTANGVVFNQADETRWGGAVGTGIEFAFAPNWSVGIEYDHLFMGTNSVVFPFQSTQAPVGPPGFAVTRSDNISQDVDMGTVRLNYRFGGPIVAKY